MPKVRSYDNLARPRDWHRLGHRSFAVSLIVMVVALLVTRTFEADALAMLVAAEALALLAAVALRRSGLTGRSWSLMLWPVALLLTLLAFNTVAGEAAELLLGLIALSFVFVGLSQPPTRAIWLIVPAGVVMVVVADLTFAQAILRVPMAVTIWYLSSEMPARLLAELRAHGKSLRDVAAHDSLTGALNRTSLDQRLALTGTDGVVALIDIDHFKEFNDEFGHPAGDTVLAEFAKTLGEVTRRTDAVFRYGGEEFLVVLDGGSPKDAVDMLNRFVARWSDNPSGLTFSAGVAPAGPEAVSMADELLYQAKREGRGRIETELRRRA